MEWLCFGRMTADRNVLRLRALAHPTRLGMVQRLATTHEICACDLGDAFDVSQPTISEHLRILRTAGLVRTRRDGTSICYSLAPDAVAELADSLAGLAAARGGIPPGNRSSAASSAA